MNINHLFKNTRLDFYRLSILLLLVSIIVLPWVSSSLQFNVDLDNYISKYSLISKMSLSNALKENVLLIYVCSKVLPWFTPRVSILLLHNLSVILLVHVLNKHVKLEYVLMILLLFYVTFFLNQFRQVFSMTFAVLSLAFLNKNFSYSFLFLLIALASHVASVFVLPVILIKLAQSQKQLISKGIIIFCSLIVVFLVLFLINEKNRFDYYFVATSDISYMFLLVAFFLSFQWNYLQTSLKAYFSLLLLLIVGSCFLMSFSARLGEYALFLILISSSVANKKSSISQTSREISFLLIISLSFFCYRFFNWFFLDKGENLRFFFKQLILSHEF